MATLQELEQALIGAHNAGDSQGASILANEILRLRSEARTGADESLGMAKAVGSGAATGAVSSTLGLPGDVSSLVGAGQGLLERGLEKIGLPPGTMEKVKGAQAAVRGAVLPFGLGNLPRIAPTTQEIMGEAAKIPGMDWLNYEPQTTAEKYLKHGAAGAAGFAAMPASGMGLLARLGLGGGAGATGEAAAQALPNYPNLARFIASSLFLGPAAYYMARTPNISRLAEPLREEAKVGQAELPAYFKGEAGGVAPSGEGLQAAVQAAKDVEATTGIKAATVQGFSDPEQQVSAIARMLMMEPQGGVLRTTIRPQLGAGMEKISELARSLSNVEPGRAAEKMITKAGVEAFEAPEKMRAGLTRESYQLGRQEKLPIAEEPGTYEAVKQAGEGETRFSVPTMTAADLVERLRAMPGEKQVTATRANKIYNDAIDKVKTVMKPEGISLGELDAIGKEAWDKAQRAARKGDTLSEMAHRDVYGLMREATTGASEAMTQGKTLHELATKLLVEPAQSSLLEAAFPKSVREGGVGSYPTFFKALDRGAPEDIAEFAGHLRATNPEAFPAIARKYFESGLDEAKALEGGRINTKSFDTFLNNKWGAPGTARRANSEEIIRQTAISQGRDGEEAVKNARDLMNAAEIFQRDRKLSELDPREIARLAGVNPASGALRMGLFQSRIPWAIERAVARSVYENLSGALADPSKVDQLVRIVQHLPAGQRGKAMIMELMVPKATMEAGQ